LPLVVLLVLVFSSVVSVLLPVAPVSVLPLVVLLVLVLSSVVPSGLSPVVLLSGVVSVTSGLQFRLMYPATINSIQIAPRRNINRFVIFTPIRNPI